MKRLLSCLIAATALGVNAAPMGILVPAYFGSSSGRWGELNFAASVFRTFAAAVASDSFRTGYRFNPNR
jgi:hypothetical protein